MQNRYKILLIVAFPVLLFISVKSMGKSMGNDNSPHSSEFQLQTPSSIKYSSPNSVQVHLTNYSKP